MNKVINGDCRTVLSKLAKGVAKVQCVVTSPPYFGLRDYGHPGQIGMEQMHDCLGWARGEPCGECYVCRMVEVFRLARDVLADDGVLWLNIGDSYAASGRGGGGGSIQDKDIGTKISGKNSTRNPIEGLKKKDLCLIPSRVALALQASGWYLRSQITWCKPNGMPESVEDRPTVATESVFMFSKSERYYYDAKAVRMPPAESSMARWAQFIEGQAGSERANGGAKTNGPMKAVGGPRQDKQRGHSRRHNGFNDRWDSMPVGEQMAFGSNLRNWWIIPTEGYDGAHFAVMPSALARICILAGSRPGDIVLDPFFGSGTVGQVAEQLGRRWIGIELNPDYVILANDRTRQTGMGI